MGTCYNTALLNAPIEQVWNRIKNFHDLSWGEPVVTKVEVVGDLDGTQTGAQRILNDAFHETLKTLDDGQFEFSYSIDNGPGPVAHDKVDNYIGKVKLRAVTDTNQTFIEWTSSFESSAENEVSDFCNPIYVGLLEALKSRY